MWQCLTCGEESEDNFEICWNCQTPKGEFFAENRPATQSASGGAYPQSSQKPMVSRRLSALSTRYKDAYLVANVAVGIGKTIKIVGFSLATIILLGTFAFANLGGGIVVIVGGTYAFIVGFVFYVIGVIVSAQGQVLKATLDNTVGNSPFLTSDLKARIMSLPEA